MAYKNIEEGMLVSNPKLPQLGVGKVLLVRGPHVTIHFKNDTKPHCTFSLDHVDLEIAENQSDEMLDNLPPFEEGEFKLKKERVNLANGIDRFRGTFPMGFDDPKYLAEEKGAAEAERAYKVRAHERYQEAFGDDRGEKLLAGGEISELRDLLMNIATGEGMNLLSPYEVMALKDGVEADDEKAADFFRTLFQFIESGPDADSFGALGRAVSDLPVEEGKARVATWPVLTLVPFLADPTRFMFLKPEPTKACAERLMFNLLYESRLNWTTYSQLLKLSDILLKELRPLGARDYIDVQSFMWVIARY